MNISVDLALTAKGWEKDVRVKVDQSGIISAVEAGVKASQEDQYLPNRILLPALSNLHSHSFQRAMSGMTEKRLEKRDSFWTWRELVYSFLQYLNPKEIEAIASLAFMEMMECGYAAVGEFHYIHHQLGGHHYDNIAETSCSIINAAIKTGIGLTHLPVFYMQGGLKGQPLEKGQLRFGNKRDEFLEILEQSKKALSNGPEDFTLGIAPHSLRAVSPDSLKEIVQTRTSGPVHIHIAEQLKEVNDVLENFGARPVEWLLDNENVDSRWCLIHATHMIPNEIQNISKSKAVVGVCPITEANLGDGIFEGRKLILQGGRYGIGSDSNIRIALTEELRLLEYCQRLIGKERNVMRNNSGSTGRAIYNKTLDGGAQALGRKSGVIKPGYWADLVSLDAEALNFWESNDDELLDRWIFTSDDTLVCEVWSAGRQMVVHGRHVHHKEIEQFYRSVISEIREKI